MEIILNQRNRDFLGKVVNYALIWKAVITTARPTYSGADLQKK
jgi:hypothetical protein